MSTPYLTVSAQGPRGPRRRTGRYRRPERSSECTSGAVGGAAFGVEEDEHREERDRYEGELLQEDGACKRGRSRGVARPGRDANASTSSRRRCVGHVPNHAPRTASGFATSSAPAASRQRSGARNRSTAREGSERRQRDRRRKSSTATGGRSSRKRRSPFPGSRRSARRRRETGGNALQAVEALEPRLAVVVAVGALAVRDQVTGGLDLVRRIVREEPRRGRVAQQRWGEDQQAEDGRGDEDKRKAPACAGREGDDRVGDDEEAAEQRGGPQEARVPLVVCCADEWCGRALRLDGGRTNGQPSSPSIGTLTRTSAEDAEV